MRTILSLVTVVVVLAASVVAAADEIEMKNGRKFAGKIVAETDVEVSLQWRGGVMKIARRDIQEIRRGPVPEGTAPAPAPAPSPKPDPKPGALADAPAAQKPAPNERSAKAATGRKTVHELLAELDSIELERWEYQPTEPCKPGDTKAYKLIGKDGREFQKDALPDSPLGILELWVRQQNSAGGYVFYRDGAPEMLWRRLYWHEDSRDWQQISVGEQAFNKDARLAQRITDLACADENGRIAACVTEQKIKNVLQQDRAASAAKERKELREDCVKAIGSEAGGELLMKFHELNVDAAFAKPGRKIEIARERREVVRRLVAVTGR